MQVFIFQSAEDRMVTGFTTQQDGLNLPAKLAPWRAYSANSRTLVPGEELPGIPGGADRVLEGIARDGFYLSKRAPKAPIR